MVGLSHPPTPGRGLRRDGPGAQALFYSHCVFRAFQENSGEPYFYLCTATCSVRPQACRGCLGLKGRDRKEGKAHLPLWATLTLDLGLEREKRGRGCVGGRRLGPRPRLRFRNVGRGVEMQAEPEGWV